METEIPFFLKNMDSCIGRIINVAPNVQGRIVTAPSYNLKTGKYQAVMIIEGALVRVELTLRPSHDK